MELTVQNVFGLLLRSKLLSVEEARAMYARWQEEAKDGATNLTRFASWMVANRYVTEYQARLLALGHADGFLLNDYKILDRLGKGRMAGVYKARHQLGQIVAIKVLPPSKAKDPGFLNRFHREARLALKLKHPNIVRSFQVGQAAQPDGQPPLHYLVMEYLEGETLEEVLAHRGKFPPAEAVRLIYQALQGLQHIHQHGLVHRDLKPSNLMLVAGGGAAADNTLRSTLKILDLGLGRALFDMGAAEQEVDAGLTGEGVLLGTPDYMAPEQARDARGADIRADIYSLGCTLYHLLAGQIPFPDTNLINQMIRHATEAAAPLKTFNPAVPDGLQQILNWMMAKDPNQRYPTPERAAQALQMFLVAGAEELAAPEADPKMRPYLTWLEVNSDKGGTLEAVATGGSPVATAATGEPPVATVKPPSNPALPRARTPSPAPATPRPAKVAKGGQTEKPAEANAGRRSSGRHKLIKDKEIPTPEPSVVQVIEEPGEAADVELLTLNDAPRPARQLLDYRLDRRDFLLFGMGVVAGGLAVGIGCWLALRRGSRARVPDPDKSDAEEK